jgi:molybdate transport repressor ModE-like protein
MELVDRVAQRLKLRDLRLLDAVVRWGSMAKAAGQLHLSQPAVSKAIAEMEQVLGVRLVERGRQGVEPTPHGRVLLRRGAAIFDELRQGVAEIEFLSDPAVGEVRISASEPIAAGLLPYLIDRFSRQYPQISIYVTHEPIVAAQVINPLYGELRSRNVDLILGPILTPSAEDDLTSTVLFHDYPAVAAGTRSKWARLRSPALADLMEEPWCLQPPNTRAGEVHIEAFRGHGLGMPRKKVIASSVQIQISLLGTQRYLTIFPHSLMQFGGKWHSIKALPIRLPGGRRQVGIITLKRRTVSPAAQLFIEMAREVTKPLAESPRAT